MTKDGSVFVDGVVQCWEGRLNGSDSRGFDKEEIGVDWVV